MVFENWVMATINECRVVVYFDTLSGKDKQTRSLTIRPQLAEKCMFSEFLGRSGFGGH